MLSGINPSRTAIEDSLRAAQLQGLIVEWKALPPVGGGAKWNVVVRPSVHAATPASEVAIRTYQEGNLFCAALWSARGGMLARMGELEAVLARYQQAAAGPEAV